ncbi:PaREP1 family protein [Vulcanisaeta distributa]|uniref:PaREP1 family protein n=1 Tax=Vulcanisaeta distributa (strain DSM 14429 / JCM 11212 / NBRC 100878 / IC-017) TaxID=572478 RepID=E1QST8_VULDI|nr:PaREP1 family protein [Vulcanisaeta distributa]ADN49605.1 PaREP1 family protein [Vulcanisaeta distributa DSM 14429]
MSIPESLINEAMKRGIDIIDLISKALNLDPSERSKAHLELAERFLRDGMELIDRDPVQASEKLYKAAEEAIKAMAVALGLDEARTAEAQGRWAATLLFDAVDSISSRLNNREIRLWWRAAWFLHVEGFHEARLRPRQVREDVEYVEDIVKLARSIVK